MPLRNSLASTVTKNIRIELVIKEDASQVISLNAFLEVAFAIDSPVEFTEDIF
jgi:hypothetical protein